LTTVIVVAVLAGTEVVVAPDEGVVVEVVVVEATAAL